MRDLYSEPYQKFEKLHEQELRGTEGMKVFLVDYPTNPYYAMAVGQTSSWRPWKHEFKVEEIFDMLKGIAEGKIWAGQIFEAINFTFAIKNISRACTHQLVRIRVGAGFMQESGREGTWDKAPFITPLTILENAKVHAIYVNMMEWQMKDYKNLKDAGISAQDARFMFGHGVAQNMWMTINFRALQEWCSKRLCTTMQWEINTLARMCRDAVLEKFPHLGILLKSHCERSGGHKTKDNTEHHFVNADFNGNKVYYPYEEMMCGQAGKYEQSEIDELLKKEKEKLINEGFNKD